MHANLRDNIPFYAHTRLPLLVFRILPTTCKESCPLVVSNIVILYQLPFDIAHIHLITHCYLHWLSQLTKSQIDAY